MQFFQRARFQSRAISANLLLTTLLLLLTACAQLGTGTGETDKVDEEPTFFFYPPLPSEPKIQFLATYRSEVEVLPSRTPFEEFIKGPLEGTIIKKPYGVRIYDGSIFVCDIRSNVVQILDVKNHKFELMGTKRDGRLLQPVGIAIDEDGTRYVADIEHHMVLVFDTANNFVRSFKEPEDLTGELRQWSPAAVEIREEQLYVVDLSNGRVIVFDKESGKVRRIMGSKGSGEGQLYSPSSIAVDSKGNVYVGDTGNFRVLKFDKRGKFQQQFGSLGKRIGQFVRPKGVAVDRDGNVFVVDASFENVQIFNAEGKLLLFFGQPGGHADALNLPAQITINYDSVDFFADRVAPGYEIEFLIAVTSQFGNSKVNVYGFLKSSGNDD